MTVDTFNFALPGYRPISELHQGETTLVYRAVSIDGQSQPVIIKFLTADVPTERDLLQFRHQYTISKQLDLAGVIRPYQLLEYRRGYALVMEDFGGISLAQYQGRHSLAVPDILAIAIQLADILHALYQQRIVHKDIKPANILIHPESKQIKLIDFGIASLLPKETQEIHNPNGLEGTIAYIAPEQTGRMNRGIDYRADYYALGVTLYQLLSGTLPFIATEPMELIHCHIAKEPIPVNQIRANIPDMVAAIVGKLMAKNAEDRYQSALGLKFDLEKCLTQWQVTGAIAEFELGQRDLIDRFLIPERLYGRATEVQSLLESFDRVAQGSTEMLLIAGFSGIGKTAVINEVHQPIVRQRGYFIKGKFDQFNRNIPLSAFVQALRGLMGQLLSESDDRLAQWQAKILAALGDHGRVLIDVIPELAQIIGKQPPAPALSGSAVQNRFNLLFHKFIEVFTTAAHPLVLFLDDLQWADLASLELLKLLMSGNGYLLIVGAYRDNEVSPAHPLMLMISELSQSQIVINTMKLTPLALTDTNQLVADTLNCPPELAQLLTELIDRQTKGNPFFTAQFLKALHEDGHILFNEDRRYWECDIAKVRELTLTDDVVEFMAQQLQKLPTETQLILQLAACIGNQFDLRTLAIVSEKSTTETAAALWQALQEGLILPTSQVYKFCQDTTAQFHPESCAVNPTYRFLHDRIQQAAYSLIPEAHRATIHDRMGRLLLSHFSPTTQAERIFEIVGHLNPGSNLIINDAERIDLARWNLMAGRKAIISNAYGAALAYLNQAINLLPENAWTNHYAFTLELHHHRLDVAYLNTQFEDLAAWGEIVLQQATSLLDRIKVYETRIMALRSQGRFLEVVDTGLEVLGLLGIEFPAQPTPDDVNAAFDRSRQAWQGRVLLSLLDLPAMIDPQLLAAMQIMSKIVPSAHIAAPLLLPLLSFKQVELSIQFGNSPISIFSYADYGLILCGIIGDVATGYQFGQLALALLEKLQITAFKSRAYFIVNSFTRHWQEPLHDTIAPLLEGYRSGLESGDWECVALNLLAYSHYQYWAGRELQGLAQEMVTYREVIRKVKQVATLKSHEIYLQTILNLLGQAEVPDRLKGEFFDPARLIPQLQSSNDRIALFHLMFNQALLCYLFEQDELAIQYTSQAEQYSDAVCGFFNMTVWIFYDALIQLKGYSTAPPDRQILILERVADHQARLQGWATNAPFNHQHRWQLVAAEQARVLHQIAAAIDLYDLAIAGAKANGFIQDEALANELAAKFYLDWGKAKIAQEYLTNAYSGYDRWGAKAKIRDLERRYPQLLSSILQQQQLVESATEKASERTSESASSRSSSSSSASMSATLDLTTVLKASQTLSSEIHLDRLLVTLLHTLLENAGADKGVLLMPQEHQWFVEAVATLDRPAQVQSVPVESSLEVPHSLINIVKRSREPMVIGDASVHPTLANDVYVRQQQPKSLLCTPILLQGKLVAILYLENQFTIGAFTRDLLKVLNLLCAQAAIALDNARLFNAEQEKSQALKVSLDRLQQSELRFQTLFEKSSDAIMLLDEKGFMDCNDAAVKLFGYSHKSQLYHLHPAALSPAVQPGGQSSEGQCDVYRAKALAAGSYRFEWLHQRRNGKTFWSEIVLTQIVLDRKQVGHTIVRDISDRKSAESKLKFTQFAVDNSAEGITWREHPTFYLAIAD
jgi:PAS domain S-box-containing protein